VHDELVDRFKAVHDELVDRFKAVELVLVVVHDVKALVFMSN
jgi:hypothetical protein